MTTIDEILEAAENRGFRLANVSQWMDGSWMAQFSYEGKTHAEWRPGLTVREAIENAYLAIAARFEPKDTDIFG